MSEIKWELLHSRSQAFSENLRTVNCATKGNCKALRKDEFESLSTSTLQTVCNDALINNISWPTFQSFKRLSLEALQKHWNDGSWFKGKFFSWKKIPLLIFGHMYFKFLKLHNYRSPIPRLEDVTDSRFPFSIGKRI